jgi:hypothetical protein
MECRQWTRSKKFQVSREGERKACYSGSLQENFCSLNTDSFSSVLRMKCEELRSDLTGPFLRPLNGSN